MTNEIEELKAQDGKNSTLPPSQKDRGSVPGALLRTGAVGNLNPQWVEWLMGFPKGWTDLRPSEAPLSRKSLNLSEEQ